MEGPEKKLKVFLTKNGEPQVFNTATGAIISADQIALSNDTGNQVLNVLMQRREFGDNPAAILVTLEKLNNKAWYQFIVRAQLWKAAFSQKFPEQFICAIEKPEWWEQVKKKLDAISIKPEREFTYWKRWYELMVKPRDLRFVTRYIRFDWDHWKRQQQQMFLTSSKIFRHVDKACNVIFIYGFYDYAPFDPKYMFRIDLDEESQDIIAFDKKMLGEQVTFMFEKSFDGFFYFKLEFWGVEICKKVASLISCQQCQLNDARYMEKNLRGLFCSAQCQKEFRQRE